MKKETALAALGGAAVIGTGLYFYLRSKEAQASQDGEDVGGDSEAPPIPPPEPPGPKRPTRIKFGGLGGPSPEPPEPTLSESVVRDNLKTVIEGLRNKTNLSLPSGGISYDSVWSLVYNELVRSFQSDYDIPAGQSSDPSKYTGNVKLAYELYYEVLKDLAREDMDESVGDFKDVGKVQGIFNHQWRAPRKKFTGFLIEAINSKERSKFWVDGVSGRVGSVASWAYAMINFLPMLYLYGPSLVNQAAAAKGKDVNSATAGRFAIELYYGMKVAPGYHSDVQGFGAKGHVSDARLHKMIVGKKHDGTNYKKASDVSKYFTKITDTNQFAVAWSRAGATKGKFRDSVYDAAVWHWIALSARMAHRTAGRVLGYETEF